MQTPKGSGRSLRDFAKKPQASDEIIIRRQEGISWSFMTKMGTIILKQTKERKKNEDDRNI